MSFSVPDLEKPSLLRNRGATVGNPDAKESPLSRATANKAIKTSTGTIQRGSIAQNRGDARSTGAVDLI